MTNEKKNANPKKDVSLNLEHLLRANGYLFPETVQEVSEYERQYGNTDIILPDDMQEPSFLEKALSKLPNNNKLKTVKDEKENFAIAARSGKGDKLPDHILKRMKDDRNKQK
jgi:hypothetical protein